MRVSGAVLLRLIGKALYPVGRHDRTEPGPVTRVERRWALLVTLAGIAGLLALIIGTPVVIATLLG